MAGIGVRAGIVIALVHTAGRIVPVEIAVMGVGMGKRERLERRPKTGQRQGQYEDQHQAAGTAQYRKATTHGDTRMLHSLTNTTAQNLRPRTGIGSGKTIHIRT